jgi:hypothetical protein
MADTQYELFQDLDRHCVAGGVQATECLEAVRRKRDAITSALNQQNPLVHEVMAGRTTFVAAYDEFSRGFRGIRRFLPQPHDDAHSERLENLAKIVPNVGHFARRSIFATDNPVTCACYGAIASIAVALVGRQAVGAEGAGEAAAYDGRTFLLLALGLGFAGFVAGLVSMYRYRTRDRDQIHAREAAEYMDLNYNCHRTFDDEAWAKFVALKTARRPGTGGALREPTAARPAVP